MLHIQEENEIRRILYMLTALVSSNLSLIEQNIEVMEALDFIFAKSKLSLSMKAKPVTVSAQRIINIKSGRHPLLKTDKVVPLDFIIGEQYRGVVITGPNTGGKTVSLKTVGLLSLMAQSGLHVPVESGQFSMNNYVLSDIGDGQSITENLSTFSSHISNIIKILGYTDNQSLVLLDELGSGTDPAEGMGLASAILDELIQKNCLFVATTHYPEIKEFAENTPEVINARMTFDLESLQPLYRLEIGEAGESCALYIAKRLGLSSRLIEKARVAAYGKKAEHRDTVFINTPDEVVTELPAINPADRKVIRQQQQKPLPAVSHSMRFSLGDSVIVYPQKVIGIVYQKANEKGEIGVQIQKNKQLISHKRLKLHVAATELYPPDYDFSIIFDSVATRKAHKKMTKRHDENLVIILDEGAAH
jgi:dsDNA-specific endonuclease/ATPase MutS2